MKRVTIAVVAMMLAACGGGDNGDAGIDAGDVVSGDGGHDAARDARDGSVQGDVVGIDGATDGGAPDTIGSTDGGPGDDVQGGTDGGGGGTDAGMDQDTGSGGTDAGMDTDSGSSGNTDAGPGVDVPAVDVVPVDASFAEGGCAAPFNITVVAPTANESIETCTRSGMPIYFDFTVAPSLPVTTMTFDWYPPGETPPTGNKVAPTWTFPGPITMNGAAYTAHRQVGGLPVIIDGATSNPPLATAPNGTRGTWTFYVSATDSCGRNATASQTFTLTATRLANCPNP